MKDHIHVGLPSGAIANVSPDCPPETLNALEAVAQAAKLYAEGDSCAATCSPCPDQSSCYGEIKNRVPAPFWMIGIDVGDRYQVGEAVGEIIGFSDEHTAIVRFGIAEQKLPLECFY